MRLLIFFILSIYLYGAVGYISAIKGEVYLIRDSKESRAFKGLELEEQDILLTHRGKAQIVFKDKTTVTIGRNTTFQIESYLFDKTKNSKAKLRVDRGIFETLTGEIGKIARDNFKFQTKSLVVGIRGTHFQGEINHHVEKVVCLRGEIFVQFGKQITNVLAGQMVELRDSILSIPKKFHAITLQAEKEQKRLKNRIYGVISKFDDIENLKVDNITPITIEKRAEKYISEMENIAIDVEENLINTNMENSPIDKIQHHLENGE